MNERIPTPLDVVNNLKEPSQSGASPRSIDRPVSNKRNESIQNARTILEAAVARQKTPEMQSRWRPFLEISPTTQKNELFEAFTKSDLWGDLYKEAQSKAFSYPTLDDLRDDLAQGIFEQTCEGFMSAKVHNEGNIFLGQRDTFQFVKAFKPHAQSTERAFRKPFLDYAYVPDGMVIDQEGNIDSFVGYKMLPVDIQRPFGRYKQLKSVLRGTFGEPTFTVVTSRSDSLNPEDIPESVLHEELPFDLGNYRKYMNGLMHFSSVDQPSLLDIFNVKAHQDLRKKNRATVWPC